MKLTLEQAAQILGISAPSLRWRIRHHRVLAFVWRKPATVEIGPVVNRNVFCALADGFDSWDALLDQIRKAKTTVSMKDRVSVIRRGPREPESSYGTLSQGGTSPEEFWARRDEYAGAMKRPARKMGQPL